MDNIQQSMLMEIASIKDKPITGAFNIRINGSSIGSRSSDNIKIELKADGTGMDIKIMPNTKHESVHIPVIISNTGIVETVYNDFYIGDSCDITIVAGCGIHNCGNDNSQHDGVHTFHVGKNSTVNYIENHLGHGAGTGKRILNPVTICNLDINSYLEMETTQIKGVDSTKRLTKATLKDNSTLVVKEKLMTHGNQYAKTIFEVELDGENSSANVISRSVAKDNSYQVFLSKINGNNKCMGHSECDAIIMDSATVKAIPEITANHVDASLIHEAAIGKIAGEQIIKLMTLGLSEDDAETQIVNGFLK